MGKALMSTRMDRNTQVILSWMPNAGLASIFTLMVTAMKVSGKMICITARASRTTRMEAAMREFGLAMKKMERECLRTAMGKSSNKYGPKE